MSRNDGATASGVVGMVHINCPACGELIEVDVAFANLSTLNGAYITVTFQDQTPQHRCAGRRS